MSLAPRCIAALTVDARQGEPGKRCVDIAVAQAVDDLGVRDALGMYLPVRDTEILKHAQRDVRGRAAGRAERDAQPSEVAKRFDPRIAADEQVQGIQPGDGHATQLVERLGHFLQLAGIGEIRDVGHRSADVGLCTLQVEQAGDRRSALTDDLGLDAGNAGECGLQVVCGGAAEAQCRARSAWSFLPHPNTKMRRDTARAPPRRIPARPWDSADSSAFSPA